MFCFYIPVRYGVMAMTSKALSDSFSISSLVGFLDYHLSFLFSMIMTLFLFSMTLTVSVWMSHGVMPLNGLWQ